MSVVIGRVHKKRRCFTFSRDDRLHPGVHHDILSHENTGTISCLMLGDPGLKILSRFSAQSNESWSCIDKLAMF
jgi:hypothetical protein